MKAPIKLYKLESFGDTMRLQSQLTFIRNNGEADYLLTDGVLFQWTGNRFIEVDIPFEIVTDKSQMQSQTL